MHEVVLFLSSLVLLAWLAVPAALLALAGFSGWTRNPLKQNHCWRLAEKLLVLSMITTLLIAIVLLVDLQNGAASGSFATSGSWFGLYPAGIACWMALMVGFIGWVILRFSERYLRGDPGRERFLPWFLLTIVCVLVLVMTNNLLVLAGAWVGVSVSLHHLLTLYPERPQARMAAIQKFIVSRAGDALVVGGVVLLYVHHGTFYLPEMIQAQSAQPSSSLALTMASVVLALAALLKCAQIPFHGWLLRVMEAPTPVSALLHAGVINLGGFLWLRLFPVFDGFTAGHLILLTVGGLTAVIAVLTMMTQHSVKHALAWSTCAQMGFMLFEIGMGAYTLALLHLLAHSLYKAHSFLASGRTVKASAVGIFMQQRAPAGGFWALLTGALAAAILLQVPGLVEGNLVFGILLILAVASAVVAMPAGASVMSRARLSLLALLLVPAYGALHALLGPAVPEHVNFEIPVYAYVVAMALLMLLAGISAPLLFGGQGRVSRNLWRHFSKGLYLELMFDRVTHRLASEALNAPGVLKRIPHHPFTMEKRS
ncbi:NADH dehydrogenase subunit L [Streptosporangium jomthongense]|uniref:Probable inorganic carbon transporter subunit DabB n=1 Tax=Marinobacter aromaticivorans TaxID=1494078 RepID=A0ABW2IZ73_9GAMM|nr:NADH-quinone oxidoreductase subunit L [Marinobacter aromaticivorans]GGE78562.1 NADH dehydrogenase subunit L [Streptosporangium jomthongense]